jgi:hypothetical protein
VPVDVSSTDGSWGNQDQTAPRSGTSTDDKAKPDVEKGPEKVAANQNRAQGEETDIRAEATTSFQQQPNRTARFGIPDHLVSSRSVQKGASKTIAPETALAPY